MQERNVRLIIMAVLVLAAASLSQELYSAQSKVWLDHPDDYQKFLDSAEVVAVEDIGTGVNRPKKVTLHEGQHTVSAVWKPIQRGPKEWAWESYQAEVAAYEMDLILGLDMVPPTVIKEIDGRKGSLQLWVNDCRLFEDVQDQAPQTVQWSRQTSRMQVFDALISNWDRNPRNLMVDDEWNIVLIDHSQAYLSDESLEKARGKLPTKFDRKLMEKLRSLDVEYLKFRFGRLLLDSQIEAILARRDALLTHLEELIREKGEENVFF